MGLPNVVINLSNGAIGGLAQTTDGVVGFIGNGASVADKVQIGTPILITSLNDAVNKGLTEAENPAAYKQLKECFDEAGATAEVYVLLVSEATNQASMWDITNENGAKKLIDYSNGRVRVLGSFHAPAGGYTPDVSGGIDADVLAAVTNAQAFAEAYAGQQMPIRCALHGYAYQGDAGNAPDLRGRTDNRVGVVLGSSANDDTAGVGAFLGRIARVPVQRKASRVKDGTLKFDNAFIGTTPVEEVSGIGVLHDKGYIVPRTFVARSGYYWSGDATCSPTTDDYAFIARGRVIDKAQLIAYAVYVNELDDEVPVTESGQLERGFARSMEAIVETQILELMAGEISGVEVVIDENQNVISSNQTEIELRVTPVGYQSQIIVNLGFYNPANN